MRFVVYGPGAVGGVIGGRLAQHGHDVALIARGEHAAALRANGLRLVSPDDTVVVRPAVVEHPSELALTDGDVVVLAMKSQHTQAALDALSATAPPGITIVCAQNSVANERAALRLFANVVGMCVMLPSSHLEPGVVEAGCAPVSGLLDIGRYPSGDDATATAIAGALRDATFESVARPDIMRWKYAKLLMNLANAVEAICGRQHGDADWIAVAKAARDEGRRVLDGAGIAYVSDEEDRERRRDVLTIRPIEGRPRGGGSSWQSLTRQSGSIETDFLNGEIVLLGRLHGVPTPVNELLRATANDLARRRVVPGSMTAAELVASVEAATGAVNARDAS